MGDSDLPPQPPDLRSCCLPCGRAAAGCGRTFPAAATPVSQPRRASGAAYAARSCEPAGWQLVAQLLSRLGAARGQRMQASIWQLVSLSCQQMCVSSFPWQCCPGRCFAFNVAFLSFTSAGSDSPSRSVLAVDTKLDSSLLACIARNPSGGSQEPSLQPCPSEPNVANPWQQSAAADSSHDSFSRISWHLTAAAPGSTLAGHPGSFRDYTQMRRRKSEALPPRRGGPVALQGRSRVGRRSIVVMACMLPVCAEEAETSGQ